jgi:Protein of unknown function (DUF1588)
MFRGNARRMKTYDAALLMLGAALATASCSGHYAVGVESGTGGGGGSAASGGSAGTGGASGATGGSGGQAGSSEGSSDAGRPSRCSFMPDYAGPLGATTSSMVVLSRIHRLLDDSSSTPPGPLPAQPSAAWAAAQATAILDGHFTAGTEAPGLVRFLTGWLQVAAADAGLSAAHTWSVKLLEPTATLTTLLAGPTSDPRRIGILTDRQLLTARPTISRRGVWMAQNLLCTTIPSAPANIPIGPGTGVTRREKLESQVSPPQCQSCHVIMDPPAYSLEHFDDMGAFRNLDNGAPVDSSGTIQSLMLSFDSIDDLAPKLATSCAVAQCFAKAVMSDASTVSLTNPFSEEEINHVANVFADSNFSIRELVKAIVATPSFMR